MKKLLFCLLIISTFLQGQVPFMVKDIQPGATGALNPFTTYLMPVANGVAFSAAGSFWFSDGTTAGTNSIKNLTNISNSFKTIAGKLYFWANDGVSGTEIWESDGTTAGTNLFKDVIPGATGTSPSLTFKTTTNKVYFISNQPATGAELYVFDGTTAGTGFVKDINPGVNSASITVWIEAGAGSIYFVADNGTNGKELWFSDGTAANTYMVKDVRAGVGNSNITFLESVNNQVYFAADDGVSGNELWTSDGTSAGTFLLKEFNPGSGSSYVTHTYTYNNKFYCSVSSYTTPNVCEMLESDGTLAGTSVRTSFPGSPTTYNPIFSDFYTFNNDMYFFTNKEFSSTKDTMYLYKMTNAMSNITLMAKISVPELASAAVQRLMIRQTNNNKFLFHQFKLNTAQAYAIIGVSDGTAAGTKIAHTKAPNIYNEDTRTFPFINNTWITLLESFPPQESEFHTIDMAGNASLLKNINPTNVCYNTQGTQGWHYLNAEYCGKLYFAADDGATGIELYETDGTTAGTTLLMDIYPGNTSGLTGATYDNVLRPVVHGNKMFFMANNGTNGYELWALTTCAVATGTDESETDYHYSVFPNPASTQLYIKSDVKGNSQILVTDVLGKHVLQKQSSDLSNEILNISELNSGVYFISISTDGKRSVQKFVKE